MLRTGTLARDTLIGTDGSEEFLGLDGNDVIFGNGGRDFFDGGLGHDRMVGGTGADTMLGGEGNDTVSAGSGADLVQGGAGADIIYAGAGADTVHGDDPEAVAQPGISYDDLIEAGAGNDLVFGGLGNDEIQGEGGNDTITGGKDDGRLVWSGGKPETPAEEPKDEPEACDPVAEKVLSFDIAATHDGSKPGNPTVSVTVTEQDDGTLRFTVTVEANGKNVADLRGLFFHISDEDLASTLYAKGEWVSGFEGAEDKIDDLGKGATVSGVKSGPFDFGVSFGTAGIGKDDVREASFILGSSKGGIGLDLLEEKGVAARLTSFGAEGGDRGGSLKLVGEAGEVDEVKECGCDDKEAPPKAAPAPAPIAEEPATPATLVEVVVGDNLYGNDGSDTFIFAKGDGVDLIWDFQAGRDVLVVKGYSIADVDAFTFVSELTNPGRDGVHALDAGSHQKLAIILDDAGDAILFNDLGNRDSGAAVVQFDDGTLSVKELLALAAPDTTAKAEEAVVLDNVSAQIAITNSWWGGFQGEITVTAQKALTDWDVLLGTKWTVNSVWGAQRGEATSTAGGMLIDLNDADWNSMLAAGQTATIGFTAETGHAGVLAAQSILDGLWIG